MAINPTVSSQETLVQSRFASGKNKRNSGGVKRVISLVREAFHSNASKLGTQSRAPEARRDLR